MNFSVVSSDCRIFSSKFLDLESVEDHMITLSNRFNFEDGQISFLGKRIKVMEGTPNKGISLFEMANIGFSKTVLFDLISRNMSCPLF